LITWQTPSLVGKGRNSGVDTFSVYRSCLQISTTVDWLYWDKLDNSCNSF